MAAFEFSGELATGKGEGAFFTRTDWARAAFQDWVGIDPWPGTLNLQVTDKASLSIWNEVKGHPGVLLRAPDPAWCDGRCYATVVEERYKAAIVVPDVDDYPPGQVEIIAAVGLREALAIKDGDVVAITVVV
jgi:CTP-dependent riboflavin kinase